MPIANIMPNAAIAKMAFGMMLAIVQ